MAKKNYYAVRKGRKSGIFKTWTECQSQINGYSGAEYKGFSNLREAEEYVSVDKDSDVANITEQNTVTTYIGISVDEKNNELSYGILYLINGKNIIEYGKDIDYKDLSESKKTVMIKLMDYIYNLKNQFNQVIIYCNCDKLLEADIAELNEKKYTDIFTIELKKLELDSVNGYTNQVNLLAKYALECDMSSIIREIHYNECISHCIDNLENIKELNISAKEFIEKIEFTCNSMDIKMNLKKDTDINIDKHIIVYFEKNYLTSEFHIHVSREGLTLTVNQGKSLELNFLILSEFNSKYVIDKVEDKNYTYKNIKSEQIIDVIESLRLFCKNQSYRYSDNERAAHIKESITIKNNNSNERIYVYIYTNNTLEIRGKKYLLWEDICYVIEKCIGVTLNDIIGRMNVGTDLVFKVDEVDRCDHDLSKELGVELKDFLYIYDYDVIVSVKCSFYAKMRVPDYGIYIDPLTKAFEGYFKKMLLHLKIVNTEKEMNNPAWTFKCVFDISRKLNNDLHSKLNSDIIVREKQLSILSVMCDLMWTLRNKINHSGPKGTTTYNNYDMGLQKYNQIIALIKESFQLLF